MDDRAVRRRLKGDSDVTELGARRVQMGAEPITNRDQGAPCDFVKAVDDRHDHCYLREAKEHGKEEADEVVPCKYKLTV